MTSVVPDKTINAVDHAFAVTKLAEVSALVFSLAADLDPPSEEDVEAGAEPLDHEQIKTELARISRLVDQVVLEHLKVDPYEWQEAVLSIE